MRLTLTRVADLDPTIYSSMDFQDLNSKILDPIKVLKFKDKKTDVIKDVLFRL